MEQARVLEASVSMENPQMVSFLFLTKVMFNA